MAKKRNKSGGNGKHLTPLQKFKASARSAAAAVKKSFDEYYVKRVQHFERQRSGWIDWVSCVGDMYRYYTGEVKPPGIIVELAKATGTPVEVMMNILPFTLSRSKSVMSKTKIDWCDYTWNPVVGCAHRCSYCYAEGINTRFKFIEDFSRPEFIQERLIAPFKVSKPSRIFVGSMSDPYFWKITWWKAVIEVCKRNPQHTFIFLTKDPAVYGAVYDMVQPNMVLGATVDFSGKFHVPPMFVLDSMRHYVPAGVKSFISIEPLLGEVIDYPYDLFDAIIAGPETGVGVQEPNSYWVRTLIENIDPEKLYLKDKMVDYFKRKGLTWDKFNDAKEFLK